MPTAKQQLNASETLQALADRAAIHDLSLRYAQGVDRRDYDTLVALWTPDAVLVRDGQSIGTGPAEIAANIVARMKARYRATLHVVANVLPTVRGDGAASETYCLAHHWWREGTAKIVKIIYIRYLDTLVRQDGQWLFKRRDLVVEHEDTNPIPGRK